jgi:hypothetical protein
MPNNLILYNKLPTDAIAKFSLSNILFYKFNDSQSINAKISQQQ